MGTMKCYSSYGGHRKEGERICGDYYGSKKRNHHRDQLLRSTISKKRRFDYDQEMVHHHQYHHRSSYIYSKRVKKTDPPMTRAKSCPNAERDRPNYTSRKRLHTRSLDEKKTFSTEVKAIRDDEQERERKMQIQREREAARIALDKMVKTVELEDNMAVMREYGKLVGHLEFSLTTPSHSCSIRCHYIHALHFDF